MRAVVVLLALCVSGLVVSASAYGMDYYEIQRLKSKLPNEMAEKLKLEELSEDLYSYWQTHEKLRLERKKINDIVYSFTQPKVEELTKQEQDVDTLKALEELKLLLAEDAWWECRECSDGY